MLRLAAVAVGMALAGGALAQTSVPPATASPSPTSPPTPTPSPVPSLTLPQFTVTSQANTQPGALAGIMAGTTSAAQAQAAFIRAAIYCRPVDKDTLHSQDTPYLYKFLDSFDLPYVPSTVDASLGPWPLYQGPDSILWCQLWNCSSSTGGCNSVVAWAPNPTYGDYLIGSSLLALRDFQGTDSITAQFWQGTTQTAQAVLSCPQCHTVADQAAGTPPVWANATASDFVLGGSASQPVPPLGPVPPPGPTTAPTSPASPPSPPSTLTPSPSSPTATQTPSPTPPPPLPSTPAATSTTAPSSSTPPPPPTSSPPSDTAAPTQAPSAPSSPSTSPSTVTSSSPSPTDTSPSPTAPPSPPPSATAPPTSNGGAGPTGATSPPPPSLPTSTTPAAPSPGSPTAPPAPAVGDTTPAPQLLATPTPSSSGGALLSPGVTDPTPTGAPGSAGGPSAPPQAQTGTPTSPSSTPSQSPHATGPVSDLGPGAAQGGLQSGAGGGVGTGDLGGVPQATPRDVRRPHGMWGAVAGAAGSGVAAVVVTLLALVCGALALVGLFLLVGACMRGSRRGKDMRIDMLAEFHPLWEPMLETLRQQQQRRNPRPLVPPRDTTVPLPMSEAIIRGLDFTFPRRTTGPDAGASGAVPAQLPNATPPRGRGDGPGDPAPPSARREQPEASRKSGGRAGDSRRGAVQSSSLRGRDGGAGGGGVAEAGAGGQPRRGSWWWLSRFDR